jgi:hypothetical protein
MFFKNAAMSIPVIEVSVDINKNSVLKDVMKGTVPMKDFIETGDFRMFIRAIIGTSHTWNSGTRSFKYDAITVSIDHPYTDTSMFAIPHAVAYGTTSCSVQKRTGARKSISTARQALSGAAIECPLTMLLSACASRAQLEYTKEEGKLSAKQTADYDNAMSQINDQIDTILNDEPSIMLMGEQAIAINNGDLYFHQPVMPGWMSVVESVEYEAAPADVKQSVSDYRARSVDIYKGITGVAGTLDEIEDQLDGYGVGSHLKTTPWLKLPNKETFEFTLTPEIKSFMKENGKYALGLFTNILAITYPNLSLDAVAIGGVTADLVRKFKRLGIAEKLDTDSQDFGMIEVVERAFHPQLKALGEQKLSVIADFSALLDLKLKRLNFKLLEELGEVTRQDVYFYKKIMSTFRRTRAKWSVEHSNATKLKQTVDGTDYLEVTLPSGAVAKVGVTTDNHFDANASRAAKAVSDPADGIVEEMIDFADLIENVFLYMVSGKVAKEDLFGDINTDTSIKVGGIYRTMADAVHHSITSPDPVIVIPVD